MARYRRAVALLEADVGDELVALDTAAGTCFGFNSVAARVWSLLESPRSFGELHRELLEQYEVGNEECTRDLQALIEQLLTMRLIERVD